jgi:hypothetical protein
MASKHHSTRERENKLLLQTHSPKVDYSLFIMVAVLVMLERLDKRPGATPAELPPPIFAGTASISWFHISTQPLCENASGVY